MYLAHDKPGAHVCRPCYWAGRDARPCCDCGKVVKTGAWYQLATVIAKLQAAGRDVSLCATTSALGTPLGVCIGCRAKRLVNLYCCVLCGEHSTAQWYNAHASDGEPDAISGHDARGKAVRKVSRKCSRRRKTTGACADCGRTEDTEWHSHPEQDGKQLCRACHRHANGETIRGNYRDGAKAISSRGKQSNTRRRTGKFAKQGTGGAQSGGTQNVNASGHSDGGESSDTGANANAEKRSSNSNQGATKNSKGDKNGRK